MASTLTVDKAADMPLLTLESTQVYGIAGEGGRLIAEIDITLFQSELGKTAIVRTRFFAFDSYSFIIRAALNERFIAAAQEKGEAYYIHMQPQGQEQKIRKNKALLASVEALSFLVTPEDGRGAKEKKRFFAHIQASVYALFSRFPEEPV